MNPFELITEIKLYTMVILRKIILAAALLAGVSLFSTRAQEPALKPDATCAYVIRGADTLLLDIYRPAPGAETLWKGKAKPTVLNVTGGGFAGGSRNHESFMPWFKDLLDRGYPVVSIDYRLYMKGRRAVGNELGIFLKTAIELATEDLLTATAWLLENGGQYGIDARNMVITGGSAGAITVLQAEYELCNRTRLASILPEDFDYAGVMAFAGFLAPDSGKPAFARQPCPIMLLHGEDDLIVPYDKILKYKMNFYGTKSIAKVLQDNGFTNWTLRFPGHRHEIAGGMLETIHLQDAFMKKEAIEKKRISVDSVVDWPNKPSGTNPKLPWLYDGKKH